MSYFLIYSKDSCVFCERAKNWIDDYFGDGGQHYIEFKNPSKHVVDKLKEDTGHTTYPFIYCGNTFIGGYTDLCDYVNISKILKKEFDYEEQF